MSRCSACSGSSLEPSQSILGSGQAGEVCHLPGLCSCPDAGWGPHSGSKGACVLGAWEGTLKLALHHLGKGRSPAPAQAGQAANIVGWGAR